MQNKKLNAQDQNYKKATITWKVAAEKAVCDYSSFAAELRYEAIQATYCK